MYSVGKFAKMIGVSPDTLRNWEKKKKLIPLRTEGNQRRYTIEQYNQIMQIKENKRISIGYCRVSAKHQKDDLERQKQVLEMYCASNGWDFEIISDLGSGINYNKKGLKTLINAIIDGEIDRLVITHKDRLLRFGAELIFAICEAKEVEVVIINKGEDSTFEEDLAIDVLEIITVFSARLYGARSHKNKKLIDGMKKVVDDISTQD